MIYRVLADIVVVLHLLWIFFLIFGVVAGVRVRAVKAVHIAALAFALLIQTGGWYCPLTYLEIWLRHRHDPGLSYTGSFIIQYVEKLVYLDVSPGQIFVLTLVLIAVTLFIYRRKKRNNGRKP